MNYDWVIILGSAILLSIGALLGYWSRQSGSRRGLSDVGLRDAVRDARNGEFPVLVGRNEELKRMMQVLSRERNPHVLLVGEPGVGKTTLASRMATLLVEHKVPRRLKNYRMMQWNFAQWITQAESSEQLLEVLSYLPSRCIVWMDNLEEWWAVLERRGLLSLVFEGLKRKGISVIGITTPKHHQEHIHLHPRLSRFFHPIHVAPATVKATLQILETMVSDIEERSPVQLKPSALKACITYARHHLPHAFLPASAIEVLEEVVTFADTQITDREQRRVIMQTDVENAMEHRSRHYRDPRD